MPGNVVLMVTKIRNVAAPKVKEESGAAPRMLKVSMTDGVMTCHAVEVTECPRVSLKTPPGTKIKLKGSQLEVANGFIKVNDKNLEVLGGEVEALVEKWKVSSELAEFTNASRAGMIGSSGEGPPKWIPFGQKNKMPKSDPSNKDFKALASTKDDEDKDDGEFASQRQEAILEATKVEQKKFTASTKNIKESKAKRDEERRQANRENREKSDSVEKTFEKIEREREEFDRGGRGRGGRGRGRGRGRRGDREEEPEGGQAAPSKPSLFDFLQGQIPNAPPPAAKEETKTYEREKPKTDLFNKGERKDNRDARNGGGRRDNDVKGKTSNHQSSKKDEDRRKDGFSEKRDSNTDKRKDDKRKGNNADKKGDKRDGRGGERGSQPREFAPVFHGKSGEKDTEKLDKYERNLFAEEAKNRSSAKSEPERAGKAQISREGSRADMNKHQNGHHSGGGPGKRNQGGNDQDFGQWNGSGRQRQTSNLSKEEMLANGMHGLNIGGRGHHQQDNSYHNQNQGSRGYSDPKVARSNSDRRQGPGFSEDRGQRGRGGHHQSQSLKLTWREGQKCMAKYWEVISWKSLYFVMYLFQIITFVSSVPPLDLN